MDCKKHHQPMRYLCGNHFCVQCIEEKNSKVFFGNPPKVARTSKMNPLAAGVPAMFKEATFDNFYTDSSEMVAIRDSMEQLSRDFKVQRALLSGVLYLGLSFTDTIHLAAATIHTLLNSGFSARYMSISSLARQLDDIGSRSKSDSRSSLISELIGADLLVIDEIGDCSPDLLVYRVLRDVIDGRSERRYSPTIVLGHCAPDQSTFVFGGVDINDMSSASVGFAPQLDILSSLNEGKSIEFVAK